MAGILPITFRLVERKLVTVLELRYALPIRDCRRHRRVT
jgi:hypothetical protein